MHPDQQNNHDHHPGNTDLPPDHDPYAFIFEEKKKSKKGLVPPGNSRGQRLVLTVVGIVILMLLVILVIGLLGNKGSANKAELESLAQQEAEIIRIANIGLTQAKDPTTKNLAATTSAGLSSNQTTLLAALKKNGIKLGAKQLMEGKNSNADAALDEANQTNNFDSAFTQELTSELTSFRANAQKNYDNTSSKSLSTALSQAYEEATVLLAIKSN